MNDHALVLSAPSADRTRLQRLAIHCQLYSPLVGLEDAPEPESLWLDLSGSEALFGGEWRLIEIVQADLASQGFQARIATADTWGAAWGISHFAAPVVSVVPRGEHSRTLIPLPVAALRVSSTIIDSLRSLDVTTVGRLMKLPAETLPSRFGKELGRRLDQALGFAPEMLTSERLVEPICAEWLFEEPVSDRQTLDHVCGTLLERMLVELGRRQAGLHELHCRWLGTTTEPLQLRLWRPSTDRRHLEELLRLHCERCQFTSAVTGVRLEVVEMGLPPIRQTTLFADDSSDRQQRLLAELVERLGSRLGSQAVLQSHLHPTVPAEDPTVYDMLCRAESIGVFQVESRAQMSMLPRLKPRCFYDLVVEVAIVRPGPIQGGMVHPFLRRRSGEEPVSFPSEAVRGVLQKTLGVPIFQEQAMKLAVVAAGFTPGEADQLRRAMGAWRRRGVMQPFREKLLAGMLARGYDEEFANRVYDQIQGFGEYGFPESHAASFALLVYASAWLKRFYPAVFTAALLNSQPLGFYAPAQLITEVRREGVEMRPVDANASDWDCTLEQRDDSSFALRLGWRIINGLRRGTAEQIVIARQSGSFVSQADFARRTGVGRSELTLLAKSGALQSLTTSRRTAQLDAMPSRESAPLFATVDDGEPDVSLPLMTSEEEVVADYQTAGLSLGAHPLSFLRPELSARGVIRAVDLAHVEPDRSYRVAGLALLRQRPATAKGITFMTLEDETGQINLIVHVNTWERFRPIARGASALIVRGILQRQHGVTHLLVDQMVDLTATLGQVAIRSRDFR